MPTTKQISSAAHKLLNDRQDPDLPVDVEAIARAQGVTLVRDRFEPSVSGVLIREEDSTVIAVNQAHRPRRQRFTIAHELGHYLLHPGRQLTVDSSIRLNWRDDLASLATDREEIEANAFAAELLMPRRAVMDELTSLRGEVSNVTDVADALATKFDVSTEAMGYRLINLGIFT